MVATKLNAKIQKFKNYQVGLLNHLERAISYSPHLSGKNYERGGYPYIPFSNDSFLNTLTWIKENFFIRRKRIKFLDVGCGIGSKLFLAERVGFDGYGLDFNRAYLKIAESIVGIKERLFLHDALTFDKYNEFDVIYWYEPIFKYEQMRRLERKIIRNCKKGCILFSAYILRVGEVQDEFKKLPNGLWRKK